MTVLRPGRRGSAAAFLAALPIAALAIAVSLGAASPMHEPSGAGAPAADSPAGGTVARLAPDGRAAQRLEAQAQAGACAVPVQTGSGVVCGVTQNGWREYLGVPYAAAPTGTLRWQPPQAPAPWTAPYQATQPGPHCYSNNIVPGPAPSEDCLWLNVYLPPGATATSKLPVMVWIHGGAFQFDDDSGNGAGTGTGSGQDLADHENVIVVRVSYRLGPFGFLAGSALGARPGNYGVEDQQAALRWVNHNITPFGGDPANVTLFGQSAGATSTCLQLMSPGSRGLFRRAIIQSGWYQKFFSAASCSQQLPSPSQAEATAQTLANRVGCTSGDVAACLRSVPPAQLLSASGGLAFTPVVDGQFVPAQPQAALTRGQFTHVPVIVGVARNEGLPTSVSTWSGFTQTVQAHYGSDASRVLAAYPQHAFPSATVAAGAVVSDQMVCNALTAANRLAQFVPTYMYRWDDVTEPFYSTSAPDKGNILAGAYHSAELPALFPGWALPPAQQLTTPDQAAVSDTAMRYWGGYARSGEPAAAGTVPWPPYRDGTPVMSLRPAYDSEILDAGILSQTHHCSLWQTVPS